MGQLNSVVEGAISSSDDYSPPTQGFTEKQPFIYTANLHVKKS